MTRKTPVIVITVWNCHKMKVLYNCYNIEVLPRKSNVNIFKTLTNRDTSYDSSKEETGLKRTVSLGSPMLVRGYFPSRTCILTQEMSQALETLRIAKRSHVHNHRSCCLQNGNSYFSCLNEKRHIKTRQVHLDYSPTILLAYHKHNISRNARWNQ